MRIDKNSADIAANYIYNEIEQICEELMYDDKREDDAIVDFRIVMSLCDVLFELDNTLGAKGEQLINSALTDYNDVVLSQIQMPSWPY